MKKMPRATDYLAEPPSKMMRGIRVHVINMAYDELGVFKLFPENTLQTLEYLISYDQEIKGRCCRATCHMLDEKILQPADRTLPIRQIPGSCDGMTILIVLDDDDNWRRPLKNQLTEIEAGFFSMHRSEQQVHALL